MKNTLTKVLAIVAAALVLLIAAAAVTLSIVKSDFNEVINTDKIEAITVYLEDKDNCYTSENDQEVFNKIIELYNKGTKESIISALFQGAYSEEAQPETLSTSKSVSSLQTPETGKYVLKFSFAENQALVVDGETITDSSIYGSDKTVYFNSVYFVVEDNTTLTKVNCYIVTSTSSTYCYRYVSFATHHSELHDYIGGLDFPG